LKAPAERNPIDRLQFLGILLFGAIVSLWTPFAHSQALVSGLSYLGSSQGADGSWGDPLATPIRDTTVVVDTFALLGVRSGPYLGGSAAISALPPKNNDDLARGGRSLAADGLDIAATAQALLDAQQDEILDPAAPGFPGRGWGLAPGFGVTSLDTALVLRALQAAGLPSGLAVVEEQVAAGTTSQPHTFDVSDGASELYLEVRDLSAALRFTLTNPGGSSYFIDVVPASAPLSVVFPVSEGEWGLTVQNSGASPASYTAEVGFTDADGFDTFRITTALTFLGLSQNPDGGWGIAPGGESQLMVTAEVLRTLATSDGVFPSVLAAATAWLQTHQNPDGGFGSEAGVSNVNETALATLSVGLADPALSLDSAATYLEAQQQANGSWGDNAYQTGAAMQALFRARPLSSVPEVTSSGGAGPGEDFVTDRSVEVIKGTLGFGGVDVQVNQPGSIVDVDLEAGTFVIRAPLAEGTNSLVITAVDGFGRSMGSDAVNVNRDSSLIGQDMLLERGFNMVGLRLQPANPMGAMGLLELLGPDARSVERLDPVTGTYDRIARSGAGYQGSDFPIHGLDSLIITTDTVTTGHIAGTEPIDDTVDLLQGVNGLTIPEPPAGLDAYELLGLIGDETSVSAIQRFNLETGAFETAFYDGTGIASGDNFPIERGVSYQVHMRQAVPGFVLPREILASIRITNPADGMEVTESPILVSGSVSGEAPYTVFVNGIPANINGNSFEASVPLVVGDNLLEAELTDGGGRTARDNVSVTYGDPLDYTIPPGGSATGARIFTADAAILDQIAFYNETQIGVPAQITYTTTGVARISPREMEIDFQIDAAPGAASGIYDFQVEYGLLDSGSNPLGPLNGNLFDFRIEVAP
jgi:hypothetical protein